MGNRVAKGDLLGVISDPFGDNTTDIRASHTGIIIGATTIPLLNKGDAAFHIASFDNSREVQQQMNDYIGETLA